MSDLNNFFFLSEDITEPYSDEWEAKRRVGNAIRHLTEVLVTSSPKTTNLHQLAEQLEKTAEEYAITPRTYGRINWTASCEHGSFGQINHELNPLSGHANPIAPPLTVYIKGDKAYGNCRCGWAYEGPPERLHGGYIAALFDEFLGRAQRLSDNPGLTAKLDISYHAATPLNTNLSLEGWIEKTEDRKTFFISELRAGETLCAHCRALFIQPAEMPDIPEWLKTPLQQAQGSDQK